MFDCKQSVKSYIKLKGNLANILSLKSVKKILLNFVKYFS